MDAVAVDGVRLFYRESGAGSPILFVHGTGGDADVWGEAFEMLSRDHRVIAYDRRGFTRSKQAAVADVSRHREDAAELLRALDAAPATVVGWSSGGIVALDLAIHHPRLVSGLVLEEPPLHRKRRPGLHQLRAVIKTRLLARTKGERAASEALLRWAFRYTSGGTGYDRLPDRIRDGMLANGEANMAELEVGTGEHLTKEQVRGIACPVTCLTAELSDRALVRATGYIAKLVPQARETRIDGAGHAMHLERPREFAAAVHRSAASPHAS
jgi:pimeloyl-ACP methyl ester carboxylesterase